MSANTIERNIEPPVRDLGDGFYVRRALPSVECRMVGPFVFFDQFGPASFAAGAGLDVRPHPHIGLATVTYLFEGEIVHRDSLGSAQTIRAGDVNWMVAGRGIAHSERTGVDTRRQASSLAGIQSWVALPQDEEEQPGSFAHHAARDLPLQFAVHAVQIKMQEAIALAAPEEMVAVAEKMQMVIDVDPVGVLFVQQEPGGAGFGVGQQQIELILDAI